MSLDGVQLDTVSGARLSQPQQIEKAKSVYPDSTTFFASCVLRLRQARSVSLGGRVDTVLLCARLDAFSVVAWGVTRQNPVC